MKTIRNVFTIIMINALFVYGFVFVGSGIAQYRKAVSQPESVSPQTELPERFEPTLQAIELPIQPSSTIPNTQAAETTEPAPFTPTQTQKQIPNPTPDTRCIVIVDGVSYNVTAFRSVHEGGDIFNCGTDMSTEFWSQHNDQILQKLQRYRI